MTLGVVVVFVLGPLILGLFARQGRYRGWLVNYRNPTLPAIYRNLALVAPFLSLGMAPASFIAVWQAQFPDMRLDVTGRFAAIGVFGAVAVLTGFVGVALICAARPPGRLIPGWLREEDRCDSFRRPAMDLFDKLTAAAEIGFLLLTVGLLLLILTRLFAPEARRP